MTVSSVVSSVPTNVDITEILNKKVPLPLEEFIKVLRKKINYIEGFADAIDNKYLRQWVNDVRCLIKHLESEELSNASSK